MTDESIEAKLGDLLREKRLKLATAESCTGGQIGDRITNVPGSSDYFLGGVVSYAYEAKVELLGVSWDTLSKFGAVSRETVLEMARGVRLVLRADIALAVSGIAGPSGGLPNKPVGTTWIGISSTEMDNAWLFQFPGDRLQVKERASTQAIQLLIDHLSGPPQDRKVLEPQLQLVEVHARFDEDGQAYPLVFVLDADRIPVASTGRRWEDSDGHHILVQDYQDRVYELLHSTSSRQWYLRTREQTSRKL
jgi:nicotinamide-nucleotide amidase